MAIRLSMNIGFVTNSSSVVHHFPRQVLDHPDVRAFMQAFEVEGGFIGADLWHRAECSTVAITKEQKEEVVWQLNKSWGDEDESSWKLRAPAVDTSDDSVVIVYGDEHSSLASSLSSMMARACKELGLPMGSSESFN